MIFNSMSIIAERPKHSLQIKAGNLQEKLDNQNINGLAEEMNLYIYIGMEIISHEVAYYMSFMLIWYYYALCVFFKINSIRRSFIDLTY